MAVVIDDHQMANVECGDKNPGNATTAGWGCLFLPMPHLCTFATDVVRNRRLDWTGHRLSIGFAGFRATRGGDGHYCCIHTYIYGSLSLSVAPSRGWGPSLPASVYLVFALRPGDVRRREGFAFRGA